MGKIGIYGQAIMGVRAADGPECKKIFKKFVEISHVI